TRYQRNGAPPGPGSPGQSGWSRSSSRSYRLDHVNEGATSGDMLAVALARHYYAASKYSINQIEEKALATSPRTVGNPAHLDGPTLAVSAILAFIASCSLCLVSMGKRGSTMSADATLGSIVGSAARQERQPLGALITISIFWFALNFHWAALLILLIPDQVIGLLYREAPGATLAQQSAWVDANKPLTLALVLAPGLIVALIANPLVGLLSDRTPGRFGRRRPYILGGTLLNVVGLLLMAFAPSFVAQNHSGNALAPSILVLTGALMLVQLANNAAAAPFHALLPDLVPREQRGFASGIMGLALLLGQIGGVLVISLFGANSAALLDGTQSLAAYERSIAYGFIAVCGVILLMALLTVIFVRERPWDPATLTATAREEQRHTVRDLTLTVLATLAVSGLALLAVHLIP